MVAVASTSHMSPHTTESATSARAIGGAALCFYLGSHLAIGVLGYLSPIVATAHAVVIAVTLLVVAAVGHDLSRLVALTSYAALGDVYWRMTRSHAPWELSKYLLIIGSLSVLLRFARTWSGARAPVMLGACVVPGLIVLILENGLNWATRDVIASVELGLLALAAASLAFRQLWLTEADAWNLCWLMLGPVTACLGITTWATLSSSGIAFTDESNFQVTGGFGPNQVSTILGLGVLLCVVLAMQGRGAGLRVLALALGFWLAWAAFLTFSRGGIYSLMIAGGAALLVGSATKGARTRSIMLIAVGVVGLYLVFASANDFSGNWLETRYESSSSATSGRSNLADQDFDAFLDHPLMGVGVGNSRKYHSGGNLTEAPTHTEYTRILAEHGILGVAALVLLAAVLISGLKNTQSQWNRFLAVSSGAWALSTMLHAATRLGAVPLIFAVSQLKVESDQPTPKDRTRRDH